MGLICNWLLRLFIIAYITAIVLFFADIQGWFGDSTGPLARLFMARLGFPWNRMLDGAPAELTPWVAMGAPIVNILLLNLLANQFKR